MNGLWVADASWPDIEDRLRRGALGLLPVGAASKAHGRHLPMNTDFLQAQWLAARLAERHCVVVWPTLAYGHYPAFLEYPGSCSLSRETFRDVVRQVLDDILRAGTRGIVVLNTGISTIDPLQAAMEQSARPGGIRLANVYQGPEYLASAAACEQQARGGHADELETSIMLAIQPACVSLEKAQPWADRAFRPGPFRREDAADTNYSPSGVYGDPTLASAEKGWRLLEAMLKDLERCIEDLAESIRR